MVWPRGSLRLIVLREPAALTMWPGAAVSRLYSSHPESRYFAVTKDQCEHYAKLKGIPVEECEHWLSPILGY